MLRLFQVIMPYTPLTDFRGVVPSLCDQGIDLIKVVFKIKTLSHLTQFQRMLVCNPVNRIVGQEALEHPYFQLKF